jgi:hypothetical protein
MDEDVSSNVGDVACSEQIPVPDLPAVLALKEVQVFAGRVGELELANSG